MGKFKASSPLHVLSADPSPTPDAKAIEKFASGASTRSVVVNPWDHLDPKAKPTNGINLRLNDYELSLIRYVAQLNDRSIQKTIKRLLIPAIEAEASERSGRE